VNNDQVEKVESSKPHGAAAPSKQERDLTIFQRAGWGALGAVLPLCVRLAGEAHVYEKATSLRIPGVIDALFPAVILILVGAAVAAVFHEERNRRNLLIFGITAPALINTWAAYGTASSVERKLQDLKDIQSQSAPAGSAVPTNEMRSPGGAMRFDLVSPVYAADQRLRTFEHAEPTALEKIQGTLSGSTPNRDYFVVLGTFSSVDVAQKFREIALGKLTGLSVELYGPPPGYVPALYSVVVSPNRTIDEAKALQSQAVGLGYSSTYIWTFGLPLRPSPECSTTPVKEHIFTALEVGSQTVYIYILKQRLWHQDQYAEVYFFTHKPWTGEEIKGDDLRKRITDMDPTAYVKMNLRNEESISLPFVGANVSFSLKMHQVKSYADVKICLN
jgi:hypothetical protein